MNEITTTNGVFSSAASFESAQRMAMALSKASLVPQTYQNNLPNSLIALEVAQRIGASPLLVMQHLYIVHGRPAWSSQFMIASCNQCGRFSALQYEFRGKEGSDEWSCRAYATEKANNQVVHGPWVSIAMAKAEGWYGKNGSKWKTMPELMLTYRAASFFVKTKAPEISMGMQTVEEAQDMGKAERVYDETPNTTLESELMAIPEPAPAEEVETISAPTVDPETQPESDTDLLGDPVMTESQQIKQGLCSAIDTADTVESLEQIGSEIRDYSDKLSEDDLKSVRAVYALALKGLKKKG